MFARIIRELKKIQGVYYTADHLGNIYAQKGNAKNYPCVVAHMDSVHDIVEDLHVLEFNGILTGFNRHTMKQTGIGGDDKVGIYIALKCLEKFDNIKAVFFVSEEVGCVGSGECDMSFFKDCRFVLQADRKGSKDFITSAGGVELSGKEFQDAVKTYVNKRGFSFATGMMTDVQELKRRGLSVACANVSCGYHRPHQSDEFVVVRQVENTLSLFRDIIANCTDVYKHEYKPVAYQSQYNWNNDFADWNKPKAVQSAKAVQSQKVETCDCCNSSVQFVKWNKDFNIFMCEACIRDYA